MPDVVGDQLDAYLNVRGYFVAGENIPAGSPVTMMSGGSILTASEIDFIETNVMETFRDTLTAREIFPVNARQHLVQLSTEGWPANAVSDINVGRATLQARGFVGLEPMLVGSASLIRTLDVWIANTRITYRQALLGNGLLSGVYEVSEEEDGGDACAILMVDAEINDLTIPTINQEFFLNWREIAHATPYVPTKRPDKFTEKVVDTAWKLLEEYMTDEQYHAFIEGTKIELQNKEQNYRLILDKKGEFMILQQKTGAGIVSSSGRIRSYDYPLGDEIAAFIDWFQFKTEELISQWNCGTYGIVKEGQRR